MTMSTCRMATTPCSIPSINTRSTELTSSITRVIRSPVARLSNHRSGSSWMCEYKSLRKIEDDFLFKCVVQDDAQCVEPVLNEKCNRGQREERQQFVRSI